MATNSLTPAAERIVLHALEHFAERGYDAASLNDIAGSAGIKKASLYAHFTGKDDLYSAVLNLALQHERDYVAAQFKAENSAEVPGECYVTNLQTRYAQSAALRFLLRAAFYPPAPLEHKVKADFGEYLTFIRGHFQACLERSYAGISAPRADLLAEAYLALIDSLNVELIYGNDAAYLRRFDAIRQLLSIIGLPLVERSAPDMR
ncbi:TetR family transcriptional regulator [Pseudomonas marincola]|uniref:TetR family transcriptional regulator n=1 Tax=Pseudomonas marincola TaxID=437900 RepID=A0A653E853_9PSED|nr:TetR/AcrR family transcriptional regulator [Pseudomonas marincola]CAE6916757.1 TetR family transcriptional regulator [Pseudomonas marincola]